MTLQTAWKNERLFAGLPSDPARTVCYILTGLSNTSTTAGRDQALSSVKGSTLDRCIRAMACVCQSWRQHPIIKAFVSASDTRILRQINWRNIRDDLSTRQYPPSFVRLMRDLNIPTAEILDRRVFEPGQEYLHYDLESRVGLLTICLNPGGSMSVSNELWGHATHTWTRWNALHRLGCLRNLHRLIMYLSARLLSVGHSEYQDVDILAFSLLTGQHPFLRIAGRYDVPPNSITQGVNPVWARMNALTITAIAFLANWMLRR